MPTRPESDSAIGSQEPQADGALAGAPSWVTRDLIDLTIRVWQPYYLARLTDEDAVGMILSVGRLQGALSSRQG